MSYSKKLRRQFKRSFGIEDIESCIVRLEQHLGKVPPDDADNPCVNILRNLPEFLSQIDATYEQNDTRLQVANRNLEISSLELNEVNTSINAMIDSLGQGFLIFDHKGMCSGIYSKACENLLETIPAGKNLVEVLKIPQHEVADVHEWIRLAFSDRISFTDMAALGPQRFQHSKGKSIYLEYRAVRATDRIRAILLIATDRSAEEEAQRVAESRRRYVDRIVTLIREKQPFQQFVRFVLSQIKHFQAFGVADNATKLDLIELKRILHTIKGGAGTFFLDELRIFVHDCESELELLGSEQLAGFLAQTARGMDQLLREFLTEHAFLLGDHFLRGKMRHEVEWDALWEFFDTMRDHNVNANIIENFVTSVIAEPFSNIVKQYAAVAEGVAKRMSKKLKPIRLVSGDLQVVRSSHEEVWSSLIHLIQNSVDHGVEPPDERVLKGKDPAGLIEFKVRREVLGKSATLVIEISDDGAGIDIARLRSKLANGEALSDAQVVMSIFNSGVSTAQRVSEISGRGIGMNVVKEAIERLGGRIEVQTQKDAGTQFTIYLPEPNYAELSRPPDSVAA